MSHFVTLRDVTRQWNGRGGVSGVSLDVAEGSFVSVLGPSGCGKSTLLRLISGLEQPARGAIGIAGREVTQLPASRRGLSMVFQSYALFPHLSVSENVLFGLKVRKVPRQARREKLDEALGMLGLQGLEARRPAELSGGQRQRVALARAVVSGHPLCLMDEPLSNLDAKLRHSVRRDIKALQRKLGLTVIYVTHDQTEAMSLSDRVVLMRDGRIEQADTPQVLYDAPASTFAAEFVGDPPMAMIDGAALGMAGSTVGVRPEHVSLVPPARADLTGLVREVEFLGAQTLVVVGHPAARGLVAATAGHAGWRAGQEVGLRIPERNRVLFDAQSGRAEKDPQQDYGADHRQTAPRDSRKARHPQPQSD